MSQFCGGQWHFEIFAYFFRFYIRPISILQSLEMFKFFPNLEYRNLIGWFFFRAFGLSRMRDSIVSTHCLLSFIWLILIFFVTFRILQFLFELSEVFSNQCKFNLNRVKFFDSISFGEDFKIFTKLFHLNLTSFAIKKFVVNFCKTLGF